MCSRVGERICAIEVPITYPLNLWLIYPSARAIKNIGTKNSSTSGLSTAVHNGESDNNQGEKRHDDVGAFGGPSKQGVRHSPFCGVRNMLKIDDAFAK